MMDNFMVEFGHQSVSELENYMFRLKDDMFEDAERLSSLYQIIS